MTPAKRTFDIALALILAVPLLPVLAGLMALIWLREGRPVLYGSERMKTPVESFTLWKLRSMRPAADDAGVSGGDKAARITPLGRVLRRSRADEIPQLWNVLRGDMSFVGPRPPLRAYVDRFPGLYGRVLRARPGVTGLATVVFHAHEERLLAPCRSAAETDRVYAARCVPRKARLDLIYRDRQSLCLDVWLIWRTAFRRRMGRGRRVGFLRHLR